jgi:hypothetical protein
MRRFRSLLRNNINLLAFDLRLPKLSNDKKYLEKGAVVTDGSGQFHTWSGSEFSDIELDADLRTPDGSMIYYDWEAPEGSQDRGKPYIQISDGGLS